MSDIIHHNRRRISEIEHALDEINDRFQELDAAIAAIYATIEQMQGLSDESITGSDSLQS
jgi:hypothetical protein